MTAQQLAFEKGYRKTEWRTNFDDIFYYKGNRCHYIDETEAVDNGFSTKDANKFSKRVNKLSKHLSLEEICPVVPVTVCEYDGRYYVTDGQGRIEAVKKNNASISREEDKEGLMVIFNHVKDEQALIEAILAANVCRGNFSASDKLHLYASRSEDFNAVYRLIENICEDLDSINDTNIDVNLILEAAFNDGARFRGNFEERYSFSSKNYWKNFNVFINEFMTPYLNAIKDNVNIGKRVTNTLVQQKAWRTYVKFFKRLEIYAENNKIDPEEMRKTFTNIFINWISSASKPTIDSLNFKGADITFTGFCSCLEKYLKDTKKKAEKNVLNFIKSEHNKTNYKLYR